MTVCPAITFCHRWPGRAQALAEPVAPARQVKPGRKLERRENGDENSQPEKNPEKRQNGGQTTRPRKKRKTGISRKRWTNKRWTNHTPAQKKKYRNFPKTVDKQTVDKPRR
jgi:hypothetical protein